MDVTLYGFPGSNACLATELLLEHAGVTPTHHRLVPMLHVASVKARGFPGPTVPAARIDGTRVQGTRRIARAVADAMPELGLLPLEEPARQRVLDAERQAERFQVAARRIIYGLAQDDASII
ncbi:MAG: glutathione S-transferase N-terminal domain-containing protein, partial [Gaiellales bacterium]